MATCFNAGERTVAEWRKLFETTDRRFQFKGVTEIPGSSLSIIEVIWEET